MVRVAAEGPVELPALQDAEQAHGVQELPGPADGGHTRTDSLTDGGQTGKAAGTVAGLVVQVQSGHKGAARHGGVKDPPGDRGKALGRGEEALVDAYGVDHAPQLVVVSVGVDVGDVAGRGQLSDRFTGGCHRQPGQLGQPGQGLPAAAQRISPAIQDGSQTAGAEAEALVQYELIWYAECGVVSTSF